MAYKKGNFYHENGDQVIENAIIKNATLQDVGVGEADLIVLGYVPTEAVLATPGSLCICTAEGQVGLYINKGTEDAPDWKEVTTA